MLLIFVECNDCSIPVVTAATTYSGLHEDSAFLDNRLTNVGWKESHVVSVYESSGFILFVGDPTAKKWTECG
jgi:hypothetical protein